MPPASIPVADSINVPVVVVPSKAPTTVARASQSIGFSISGKFPLSSSKFALNDRPNNVPIVSTKSITNTVKITAKNPQLSAPAISSFKNVGERAGGRLTNCDGNFVVPNIIDSKVMLSIPINIEPLIFFIIRKPIIKKPKIDRRTLA